MRAYSVHASQSEAETFYRYQLGKAGWTEAARSASQPGLVFHKDGCELGVSFTPAAEVSGREGDMEINLHFAGNYDARWLPKFSRLDSKSSWDSFQSVSYRTKAELTDVEVALLKQFHDAGWTAYTRLGASGREEPDSRTIEMLQGERRRSHATSRVRSEQNKRSGTLTCSADLSMTPYRRGH
jgi:hypothetical protein